MANKADVEVVNRFRSTVSWGDEGKFVEWGDRSVWRHDNGYVYVPALWREVDPAALIELRLATDATELTAIVHGGCSELDAERLYQQLVQLGLHATFLDIPAQLAVDGLISKRLDGIDWGRSIGNVLTGGSHPVFEWDKR